MELLKSSMVWPFKGQPGPARARLCLARPGPSLKKLARAHHYAITSAIYIDNFGSIAISVTRLGDFLHFGQEFKSGGNSYFKQIANIVIQFL